MFEKFMSYAIPIGMSLFILFVPHHARAEHYLDFVPIGATTRCLSGCAADEMIEKYTNVGSWHRRDLPAAPTNVGSLRCSGLNADAPPR
jgi:hypothetical protein